MGLIFRALFSISTTGQGSKKTQGYSYDASVPSSPPIKGQHPLLGNGPKSLSSKAIQTAKAQRKVKRPITSSAGSTTESSITFIPDTPQMLHKIETRSTISTSPKNWKIDHCRRSWENDIRWSRPTTSTSFVSSTLQRPTTGYIPASLQKKLRHLDSLPNESNTMPRLYHVDLLDAHSSIHLSETLIRDRAQASGTRSYGEDVADRNMPPELPELSKKRIETPQGSRPLIDNPELKFLKEKHLANKRAVGMIDNESIRASSPPPSKNENEKSCVYDNQVKKLSHPHSHPIRSLLGISNEACRSAEISTMFDRTRSHSLSRLSQPKPLPHTLSNNEALPKDDFVLLKNLDSSVSSHNRVYSSSKSFKSHSTPGSKKSLDSQEKYQKSRRHTYSTAVSRRIPSSSEESIFSLRQISQPALCSNSPTTKCLNPSLNNNSMQKDTHELNQKNFSKGVRDDNNRADSKTSEKTQTAINKKESLKNDDASERNDPDTSEPNHHNNGQRRYSLKQGSIKVPHRRHRLFSMSNKTESKVDGVFSSNDLLDHSGLRQESPLPYLRHDIPQQFPNYSPAEAPTIRFDRNRTLDHAESISFQEIQTISGPTKNCSADSLEVTASHERVIVIEKPKNSIQNPMSLPQKMSKEKINPILPSKKDYMRNEASLGTQCVWRLRPLLGDKLGPNSFSTDRIGTNLHSVSQNQCNHISDNDEFRFSDENLSSPKEENLFFEDNFGFDFANMLPGLRMMEPLPITRLTFSQNDIISHTTEV
ncbi:hypothetical protein EPUL_006261, partial [Erysiphe pulchra]